MATIKALLVVWKLLLFLSVEANALECFSCYHSEIPLNESGVPFSFDPTCQFDTKPNPKLIVDCDIWMKNQGEVGNSSSFNSILKGAFKIGREDVGLISWTCSTFSFNGWLIWDSNPKEFNITFRSCFPYGNNLKNECNLGRLDSMEDRYETEIMKEFINNLTSVHHLTPATETVACVCPEDNCNGENWDDNDDGVVGSGTSPFHNLRAGFFHMRYFCLFAIVCRIMESH